MKNVKTTLLWCALLAFIVALMLCWLSQFGTTQCYNIYDSHSVSGTYCQTTK